MINVTILNLKLSFFHFYIFLDCDGSRFTSFMFLNSSDLLEHLAMLQTTVRVINF